MRTRQLPLAQAIAAVGVLLVVVGFAVPLTRNATDQAKNSHCLERLHTLSVALNMYRTDNDGMGMSGAESATAPSLSAFGVWHPIASYVPSSKAVHCVDPSWSRRFPADLYRYRGWLEQGEHVRWHAFEPNPGTVVAFCRNHSIGRHLKGAEGKAGIFDGDYPVVREDGSGATIRGKRIQVSWRDDAGWHDGFTSEEAAVWHFPGESWPPIPEP